MNGEQLHDLTKSIQADSKRIRLLHILGRQLELMINKGRPDLHSLYGSLPGKKLVSKGELQKLRLNFALDVVSYRLPRRSRPLMQIFHTGCDAERHLECRG
jgi:hypothetical protein